MGLLSALSPGAGPLPRLTVIIPAYNEGPMVEKALDSVAASDYPADRLEIICIDDGSTDDTWRYIERAQRRYPHLIKPIRFPPTGGKKRDCTPDSSGAGRGLRHHRFRQRHRPGRPAPPGGAVAAGRGNRGGGRQRQGL